MDLLEVYCSAKSELTTQAIGQGLTAVRFGFSQGDLSTFQGRTRLYDVLWTLKPTHIWISPKCGPWGGFSRLNASKSRELEARITAERKAENVHLLLCDALLRFQLWRGPENHLHLEQPQGSEMIYQRAMRLICQVTKRVLCDMCVAGNLKHPETGEYLQKRTQILTTSEILVRMLEQNQCVGNHIHDRIQGSCKPHGHERMPLTKYTELYTSLFARKVCRTLLGSLKVQELRNTTDPIEVSEWCSTIACTLAATTEEPPRKHRRLNGKSPADRLTMTPTERQVAECKDTLNKIETITPRVGKVVLQQGEIFQEVCNIFPQMQIAVIEVCKGVDRLRNIPITLPKETCPYRFSFGKRRSDLTVYSDATWEHWEKLSKRQICRKGIPSRIHVTIFAQVRNEAVTNYEPPARPKHAAEMTPDESHAKRAKTENHSEQESKQEMNTEVREETQVEKPKYQGHGERFRQLPNSVQSQLLKIHKNLGHPDNSQLQQALRRSGWSDSVIQGVKDMVCETCYEAQQPKIARPAHLREVREFNDLVSFDGAEWTDESGVKRGFYHFVDHATNFQVAIPYYQQTGEKAVEAFQNAWVRWAGPPREVMFDSATSFNSEAFERYLQSQDIRSFVIPTDAHWQLGRAERHGSVLKHMLDKYHVDQPIRDFQDFENGLQVLCNAKNSMSRHAGYTPEILVFGKSRRLPGSNCNEDDSSFPVDWDDNHPEGSRFVQQMQRREAARLAFVKADHSNVIRKAIHARSRPERSNFAIGDHVMYWKNGKGVEPGSWHGPGRVLMVEQRSVIWVSHMTKLFRLAPEHVRAISARELLSTGGDNSLPSSSSNGVFQFRDTLTSPGDQSMSGPTTNNSEQTNPTMPSLIPISPITPPVETPAAPSSTSDVQPDTEPDVNNPSAPQSSLEIPEPHEVPVPTDEEDEDLIAVNADQDYWEIKDKYLIRHHVIPRLKLFFPTDCSDIPVGFDELLDTRTTTGRYRNSSTFHEVEAWRQNPSAHRMMPEIWTGKTTFQLLNTIEHANMTTIQDHHLPQNNQGYTFEIALTMDEIHKCQGKTYEQQEIFLASTAKKQRAEVKIQELSEQDKALFKKAKDKEIDSWLSTDTVRRITRNAIPEDQLLRTRWVLTWKTIDAIEQQELGVDKKAKARLVVLGFEDPQLDTLERDSPTLGRDSRMIALQAVSSYQWPIRSFDIRTAFLRGSRQDGRVLGIEPPTEMRVKMGLRDSEACELLKGAYGLINAPLLWYVELKTALLNLGMIMSPFDPCLFVLPCSPSEQQRTGRHIHGVLGIHVDDGIGGGDEKFDQVIALLEKKFPFGNKRRQSFTFTGIQVDQQSNGDIVLSQKDYINDIPSIQINRDRRRDTTSPVNKDELQSFRALIGSLQYAATNTRPDLSCRLSLLQAKIANAKISDLMAGNKLLEDAKRHNDTSIRIQSLPAQDVHFVSYSDAAFATREKANSQKGCMILATTHQIDQVQSARVSPLMWYSKKISRVVASTLASETYALSGALDLLSWIRIHWAWIICPHIRWQKPEETLTQLPPAFAVVDCKSLYDLLQKTSVPQCSEYRTLLEALVIRDRLKEGVKVKWVHSAAQMADALTKEMDTTILRLFLKRGQCILHDVDEILRQRADKKIRQNWYKQSTNSNSTEESPCMFCDLEFGHEACQSRKKTQ